LVAKFLQKLNSYIMVWFSNYSDWIIWSYSLSMGLGILPARNISKSWC